MQWVSGRAVGLMIFVLGPSTALASAQDRPDPAPVEAQPRWTLEGAAGVQTYYTGSVQSVAFGFALNRSLTLLASWERSYVRDEITVYENGYDSFRGGTEQFASAEMRYAILAGKRVSPYVLGGLGAGISRTNLNAFFPDRRTRDIAACYLGAGVRIPVRPWLDAFIDTRFIVTGEAKSDYLAVRVPVRAGVPWRF